MDLDHLKRLVDACLEDGEAGRDTLAAENELDSYLLEVAPARQLSVDLERARLGKELAEVKLELAEAKIGLVQAELIEISMAVSYASIVIPPGEPEPMTNKRAIRVLADQYDELERSKRQLDQILSSVNEAINKAGIHCAVTYAEGVAMIARQRDEALTKLMESTRGRMLGGVQATSDLHAEVVAAFESLTDEQRLSVGKMCCPGCGSLDTSCQCWNDE